MLLYHYKYSEVSELMQGQILQRVDVNSKKGYKIHF